MHVGDHGLVGDERGREDQHRRATIVGADQQARLLAHRQQNTLLEGEGVGFAEVEAAFAARHQLEGVEVPGAADLAHDVVAFDE